MTSAVYVYFYIKKIKKNKHTGDTTNGNVSLVVHKVSNGIYSYTVNVKIILQISCSDVSFKIVSAFEWGFFFSRSMPIATNSVLGA